MLEGKRILVVEDEYFIASDLKRVLKGAGAQPVGPAPDVAGGMALLEDETVDAAMLDVNLEGAISYELADRLSEQGVPFMFVTGYDGWALPTRYRAAPRIAKPFTATQVLDMLDGLITIQPEAST